MGTKGRYCNRKVPGSKPPVRHTASEAHSVRNLDPPGRPFCPTSADSDVFEAQSAALKKDDMDLREDVEGRITVDAVVSVLHFRGMHAY